MCIPAQSCAAPRAALQSQPAAASRAAHVFLQREVYLVCRQRPRVWAALSVEMGWFCLVRFSHTGHSQCRINLSPGPPAHHHHHQALPRMPKTCTSFYSSLSNFRTCSFNSCARSRSRCSSRARSSTFSRSRSCSFSRSRPSKSLMSCMSRWKSV